MVREGLESGQSVSVVARRNGIDPNQLFHWRKLYQDGSLSAVSAGEAVMPTSELADADNGSAYTAEQTRAVAWEIGPLSLTTPVCSPQSNGMAESFVKTMRRDYIAHMPKQDRLA